MFQSAIQGPDDTVQYMDTSPTVTVYSGGSRSWRTNNPGMLGFGLFAYGHGAIGQACGLAAFKDYNSGKQALAAMLGEDRFMMLTVEQAYQQFDPSYHVPPPPPPKDADPLNPPPPPPRLCPYTGIDVDKFMSAIGGGDRRKMADAIEQMLDYTPGTITKENLEEGSLNQGNQVQAGTNVLINKRSAVHAGSSGTLAHAGRLQHAPGRFLPAGDVHERRPQRRFRQDRLQRQDQRQRGLPRGFHLLQKQRRRRRPLRRHQIRQDPRQGHVHHQLRRREDRRQSRRAPVRHDGLQRSEHPAHAAAAEGLGTAAVAG